MSDWDAMHWTVLALIAMCALLVICVIWLLDDRKPGDPWRFPYKPTRAQRAMWKRERLELPKTWNRRIDHENTRHD